MSLPTDSTPGVSVAAAFAAPHAKADAAANAASFSKPADERFFMLDSMCVAWKSKRCRYTMSWSEDSSSANRCDITLDEESLFRRRI
ncbi:hypothetical protein [Paraburkholderia sp. MM5477-R1]|uniref:hypothetical protein n=1 Tax=Paraburkholderia sp. MM5477-R1 TaxID=2991062 RepID=UPI003D2245E4